MHPQAETGVHAAPRPAPRRLLAIASRILMWLFGTYGAATILETLVGEDQLRAFTTLTQAWDAAVGDRPTLRNAGTRTCFPTWSGC